MRVFPLSNWTELDVWQYIKRENLEVPSIYYTHTRDVFRRDGVIYPVNDLLPMKSGEQKETLDVRFRTLGDVTCTGGIESRASNVDDIIAEVGALRVTERGARLDDKKSQSAMEDRKKEGYF